METKGDTQTYVAARSDDFANEVRCPPSMGHASNQTVHTLQFDNRKTMIRPSLTTVAMLVACWQIASVVQAPQETRSPRYRVRRFGARQMRRVNE
jgi:hypothetical protein